MSNDRDIGNESPDTIEHANALNAEGKARAALSAIRAVFAEPDLEYDEERLVRALQVFAEIAEAIVEEKDPQLTSVHAENISSPEALYALGYHLVDLQLGGIAVPILRRCRSLSPTSETVLTELVTALERERRNAEAVEALSAAPDLCMKSYFCRYLMGLNAVLSGQMELATEVTTRLLQEYTSDKEHAYAKVIEAMLIRAKHVAAVSPLDEADLRCWHYITTGGVVTHLSQYGEDMNGRYGLLQDSFSLCRMGLERLRVLLSAWKIMPEKIIAFPDRGSQILALAAATLFDLPMENYQGAESGPGLLMAYDLSLLEPNYWMNHSPGQILFAHASSWVGFRDCAADVTTYLYESQIPPWGKKMRVVAGKLEYGPESQESNAELAECIVSDSWFDDMLTRDAPEDFERFLQIPNDSAAALRYEGRRSKFWEGSPVPSFCFV